MRTPLPKGYELKINTDSSQVGIIIGDVIGEGGCCISYKGEMLMEPHLPVIVKECFPLNLPIERRLILNSADKDDYSLIFENEEQEGREKERFDARKDMFKRGILHNASLSRLNETNELFAVGEANNTCYSFSIYSKGEVLSDYILTHFLSIPEITRIVISLCRSIRRYHKAGYIYLDCKPDNILVTKDGDGNTVTKIIDFDTIIPYEKRNFKKNPYTYSLGWAAPEQMDPNEPVSYKTDVFSIGAVLFWLLTNSKPYEVSDHGIDYSLINEIQEGSADWRSISGICSDAEQIVIDVIQNIEKKALTLKQSNRGYESLGNELDEMIGDLEYLFTEANRDIRSRNTSLPVSTNQFKYDSNSTILRGRDEEIGLLMEMCNAPQPFCWIGISGAGGTGKSKLAYELSARMIKQYWTVFSPMRFNEYTKRDILAAINHPRGNILICLDYFKQNDEDIAAFIKYVTDNLNKSSYKIRLVLIEREEKDIQINDYDIDQFKYTNDHNGEPFNGIIDLKPLSENAIKALIVDYIIGQSPSVVVFEEALDLMIRTLKSVDCEYRRPVYALFIAEAWRNNEDLLKWDRNAALDYLVGREMKRLSSIVKNSKYSLNRIEQNKYSDAVKFLYAQASYLSTVSIRDYHDVLKAKYHIPENDEMLITIMKEFSILDSDDTVVGWAPDLIGEYFCIDYLSRCTRENDLEEAEQFIALAIDRDLSAFVKYSDMIYNDFPDLICDCAWIEVMRNIAFPTKYNFVRKNQFNKISFLKSISFPGRIHTIYAGAFRNCENLERIILPSSLEIIDRYAFCDCINLKEVLPEDGRGKNPSVIKIENYAFKNCISLKEIILPESLQDIGMSAFENCCSITSICVPRKIQRLNNSTFSECRSLKWIGLEKTKGVSLGDSCFNGCEQLCEVAGSDKITAIERDAFRNCARLESISFGKKLEVLKDSVFPGCQSLTYVDMSACEITHIPERLFYGCSSLTEMLLPDCIERIDDRGFCGCENLEGITFKEGLTTIGCYAFSGCKKLKYLEFPETLRVIKSYAFESCSGLSGISFARKPKMVEDHAFVGCTGLSFSGISGLGNDGAIDFSGFTFTSFSSSEFEFTKSYLSDENVVIPDTVCAIGNTAFRCIDEDGQYRNEVIRSIIIPSSVNRIGERAFLGCKNLQYVKCADGTIDHIGSYAFFGCSSLRKIEGSMAVTDIGEAVFQNCGALETVRISGQLEKIGFRAFKGCRSLKYIDIKNRRMPRQIETAAFEGCSNVRYPVDGSLLRKYRLNPRSFTLEGFVFKRISKNEMRFLKEYLGSEIIDIPATCIDIMGVRFSGISRMKKVIIPDSVRSLPVGAFKGCVNMEEVELPATLKSIPPDAFKKCRSLKSIVFRGQLPNTIPDGVDIEGGAFSGCGSLTNIYLPNTLSSIKSCTFYGCSSLKSVVIPKGVRNIGKYAFMHCASLESIKMPSSLKILGKGALEGCAALTAVENLENTNLKLLANNIFASCHHLQTLSLPKSLKMIKGHVFEDCHNLKISRDFLPTGITEMEDAVFQGCYNIERIRIPRNIKEIRQFTFKHCSSLREVSIPDHVTYIGQSAFYGCNSLVDEGLELPSALENIGISAFAYCSSITKLRIPDKIRELPSDLFKGCSSLEEVVIPEHIRMIPANCFKDCLALRSVNLHKNIEVINVGAFRNCISLNIDLLELPEGLREVRESAFRYCDGIEKVKIPRSVIKLSSAVFEGCTSLKEVILEHPIKNVDNYAFSGCCSLKKFPLQLVKDEIGDAAFSYCSSLTNPVFSKSIRRIRSAAFRGCTNIEILDLPRSLTTIYGASFRDNTNLRKVILPETVTLIKRSAFRDCVKLSDVLIKSPEIDIQHRAFRGCLKLDYIDLPEANIVETDAFERCPVEAELKEDPRIHWIDDEQARMEEKAE